jgi:hypothetical protein
LPSYGSWNVPSFTTFAELETWVTNTRNELLQQKEPAQEPLDELYSRVRPDLEASATHAADDVTPDVYASLFAEARSNDDIEAECARLINSGRI